MSNKVLWLWLQSCELKCWRTWTSDLEKSHENAGSRTKAKSSGSSPMCRHFRHMHASHSGLLQHAYLGNIVSVKSLPSLLAWLQQSKSSVQTLQSNCNSPLVHAVLAALASFKQRITWDDAGHISTCSISIVAIFTWSVYPVS